MRRSRQTDQPQARQTGQPRYSRRRTVWPLAAPLQMPDQTALNIAFDLTVGAGGIAERKVVRPTFQMPIEFSNQARDRLEALMTPGHLAQLCPLSLDRF